jgi:hypothetical protein
MKKLLAALIALSPSVAHAEWRLDEGVAIIEPAATNSTIELLAVLCGDPFQLEVYSRGGPVMPESADVPADYFYLPGKVRALVDTTAFPLTAAGSDAAVVLFAEGAKSDNYMASIPISLIEALKGGTSLTLGFDITGTDAADGSAFETFASFPLEGSRAVLDEALKDCTNSN